MSKVIPLMNIKEYSYYDKKMLKYDKNVCSVCKNYSYLVHVKCTSCKRTFCTQHLPKNCC